MAQFVEVMKQARRICLEHTGAGCDGCPLHDDEGLACRFFLDEKYFYDDDTERIVMNWAAEHPELVYPSWKEMWNDLFPQATTIPCPEIYFGVKCCDADDKYCVVCKDKPIPAEIAKKLGIKPKEA